MECPNCFNDMFENKDLEIESILSPNCIDLKIRCSECNEIFYKEFKGGY